MFCFSSSTPYSTPPIPLPLPPHAPSSFDRFAPTRARETCNQKKKKGTIEQKLKREELCFCFSFLRFFVFQHSVFPEKSHHRNRTELGIELSGQVLLLSGSDRVLSLSGYLKKTCTKNCAWRELVIEDCGRKRAPSGDEQQEKRGENGGGVQINMEEKEGESSPQERPLFRGRGETSEKNMRHTLREAH